MKINAKTLNQKNKIIDLEKAIELTIDLKNPSSKISLSPQTSLDSNNYRNSYNINCLNTSNFTNSPTFKPGRKSEFYMRKNNCSQDFFFSQEKTKMTDKKPYRVEPPDITTFYDSIVNDKKKNATKMERSFDLIKKFEPPIRNGRVNLVYQFQTQIDNHRKKRLECNTDPKNVEDFDSDDLSEGLYELERDLSVIEKPTPPMSQKTRDSHDFSLFLPRKLF